MLDAGSARPLPEFNACFAETQDRSGRPWAYMPSASGGTFTDSGAFDGAGSYWLQVRRVGAGTKARLFTVGGPANYSVQAVEQCR